MAKGGSRGAGSFGARPCRRIRERLFAGGVEALPRSWRRSWIIARIRATPPWANFVAIRAIYAESQRLTDTTGISHEVDHEIPLQHPNVSGLHCEFNLVPKPKGVNQAKKNHWWPDQLELNF